MQTRRRGKKKRYIVQIRDFEGNMRTHTFSRKDDAEECKSYLKRTRERLRAGLERPMAKTLLFDFAANWLARQFETHPGSAKGYESKLRLTWLPAFGSRDMDSIRRGEIEAVRDALKVSNATKNRHRDMLHILFEAARKADPPVVQINPVSDIEGLSEKKKTFSHGHLDNGAQAQAYIASMYDHGQIYGCAATILAYTGPRISELLPLRWGDIDEDASTITVSKIIDVNTGVELKRTKGQGEGGSYALPLYPVVREALRLLRASLGIEPRPSDHLFMANTGRPMTYTMYVKRHRKVLKRHSCCPYVELPSITRHGLRHTAGTLMQKAGLDKDTRRIALGHKDAKTTERYSHADLSHVVEEATKRGYGAAMESKLRVVKK